MVSDFVLMIMFGNLMKCLSKFYVIGFGIEIRIMICGGLIVYEEFIFVIKIWDFKYGFNMIIK